MKNDLNLKYVCIDCGFQWNNPKKEYTNCPECKSENIEVIKDGLNDNSNDDNKSAESSNPQIFNRSKTSDLPLNTRRPFEGPGRGRGLSRECECPNCGYTMPKTRGVPCFNTRCPECGTPLCGFKQN